MSNTSKDVNYAFIDSQNLNLGIRSKGWELDFKKFRIYLNDKYHVKKAFLFIGYVPSNETLYTILQKFGYILIFKPTLDISSKGRTRIKGNVDGELILHTMIEIERFDKAVIVSGDGDFHCLIEYLESKNKLGALLVPNKKYSTLLKRFNFYILEIDSLRDILEKKRRRPAFGRNLRPFNSVILVIRNILKQFKFRVKEKYIKYSYFISAISCFMSEVI